MVRRHDQLCPIAASLNQLGDMWTLLVVREALNGVTRFGDFQRNTGIAKNLLADRLSKMVADGMLERRDIGLRGRRYEYRLTQKGRSLAPVVVAISQWGNTWLFDKGREPIALVHAKTGMPLAPLRPLSAAGQAFDWREVMIVPGPGADKRLRKRFDLKRAAKE